MAVIDPGIPTNFWRKSIYINPGYMAAGMLCGIIEELAGFADPIPMPLLAGLRYITGSGNGIRQNPVFLRLIAERFQLPLKLSSNIEEAAFGACRYAAKIIIHP